jgi:hypothetical protein
VAKYDKIIDSNKYAHGKFDEHVLLTLEILFSCLNTPDITIYIYNISKGQFDVFFEQFVVPEAKQDGMTCIINYSSMAVLNLRLDFNMLHVQKSHPRIIKKILDLYHGLILILIVYHQYLVKYKIIDLKILMILIGLANWIFWDKNLLMKMNLNLFLM